MKRKTPTPEPLDPARNILVLTEELGLRVVSYMNVTTEAYANGTRYWIPRDCFATDGKAAIIWRMCEGDRRDVPGVAYAIDGWEPWCDGLCGTMHGGRYDTYESALSWMRRALEIRAGRDTHF